MKKTLAAVLAAAMALSTATVALADDRLDAEANEEAITTVSADPTTVTYGKEHTFVLSADVLTDLIVTDKISATELGEWMRTGTVTINPTVTVGRSSLSGNPSVNVRNVVTAEKEEIVYKWKGLGEVKVGDKVVAKDGEPVKGIPVNAAGTFVADTPSAVEVIYPNNSKWATAWEQVKGWKTAGVYDFIEESIADTVTSEKAPVVRVAFTVKDTWGTKSTDVAIKFRITFKKASGIYDKGDTIITDELKFTAKYFDMNDRGTDMELTRAECGNREVLMDTAKLYDEIGNKKFTLYFEDAAAYSGYMTANQKTQNMYYTLDEDEDGEALKKMYPDVDFQFIKFMGTPTFVKTGEMIFSAIGKDDTVVYEWDGDGWNPLDGRSTYSDIYNTVTVSNVKKLTKYAIASEMLPVEEEPEEPAEPVDSTPVAEPDDDEGQNPNTGAC